MPDHIPQKEIDEVKAKQVEADDLHWELDPDDWMSRYVSLVIVDLPRFVSTLEAAYAEIAFSDGHIAELNKLREESQQHYLRLDDQHRATSAERDTLRTRVVELEEGLREVKLPEKLKEKLEALLRGQDSPSRLMLNGVPDYEWISRHNARIDALLLKEGEEDG